MCPKITQNLRASHKEFPKFKSWKFPVKITLIYVTFTASWNGQYYVVAVDYNRYIINKLCSFELGKRKHVSCECFKCVKKWIS